MKPFYEYRHIVSFAETNLVGNVYYANHVAWQGRCREMFLREYAPDIVEEFKRGLALVTVSVSCDYLNELVAFDELSIRMRLPARSQNRATMSFEYWRVNDGKEELIAHGEQQFACMRREGEQMVAEPFPAELNAAWDKLITG